MTNAMNKLVLLLALLLSGACSSTHTTVWSNRGKLLTERESEAEGRVAYRLYPSNGDTPKVNRTSTVAREIARVGVSANTLTGDAAARLGVAAWRGVHVDHVDSGSPAARGGIVQGDVMLSIGGHALVGREQFVEVVQTLLTPLEAVDVEVLRAAGRGADGRWDPMTLSVTPEARQIEETKTDSFALTSSRALQAATGMQVATLPPALSSTLR